MFSNLTPLSCVKRFSNRFVFPQLEGPHIIQRMLFGNKPQCLTASVSQSSLYVVYGEGCVLFNHLHCVN